LLLSLVVVVVVVMSSRIIDCCSFICKCICPYTHDHAVLLRATLGRGAFRLRPSAFLFFGFFPKRFFATMPSKPDEARLAALALLAGDFAFSARADFWTPRTAVTAFAKRFSSLSDAVNTKRREVAPPFCFEFFFSAALKDANEVAPSPPCPTDDAPCESDEEPRRTKEIIVLHG
jgi:hypothetical protein